jgi:hypothetical protein
LENNPITRALGFNLPCPESCDFAEFDGSGPREITLQMRGTEMKMSGEDYYAR